MPKSLSIPVTESSQVGEARRAAHGLAMDLKMSEAAMSNIGIVVTEAATNLHKHAKEGELILRQLRNGRHIGIEMLSIDRGPGIAEISRCLQDGYSTTGTKGNGLGSMQRISTAFDIYSTPQGTSIVAQLWDGDYSPEAESFQIGAICLPYPGERLIGDAWAAATIPTGFAVILADGLGHGNHAAEASDLAVEIFNENSHLPSTNMLQKLHAGLRSTRGAAVSILQFDAGNRKLACSGIGNISTLCVTGETSKSFVSLNGTIGHQAQRFQEFSYDWPGSSLVVIHSDGLQTKWKLDAYPGLQMRHPSLAAAVLFRDYRRGRDDVTVLVIR